MQFGRLLMLLLCSLKAVAVSAYDWEDTIQTHGFLSQGYVKTSANRWFGDSDDGSWDFREIGVNASVRPVQRVLLSAQLLSLSAGDMKNGSVGLDYALMDWAAVSKLEYIIGLRAGRIKNPLGFYNETRDVAFTRPGVFLPQSVYFDRVRDLGLSLDGIQVYGDWQFGDDVLSLQANLGYPQVDANVEAAFLGRDWQGELKRNHLMKLGRLMYEHDGGRVRFALSGAKLKLDFERGAQDPAPPLLDNGHVDFFSWIASVQYNAEDWSLTAEMVNQDVDWVNLGTLLPDPNSGQGYYVQGDYRFSNQWSAFLRYGARFLNVDDRDGSIAEQDRGVPGYTQYAKDWTVGMRWDPMPDVMLRAEYHWVDGTAWLSNRENRIQDTERYWDMLTFLISYRF